MLQDEEDKKSGKSEDITEMYDLTYLTFQKDLNQRGAYRLNWKRPNKSLMIVDITNLKVLGSPTRITHYSNAALKPLKKQMCITFEERNDLILTTPNAAARAGRRPVVDTESRRQSYKPAEGDDENIIWYKNVIQRIRHYMLSPDLEVNLLTNVEINSDSDADLNGTDVHANLLPTKGEIKVSFSIEEIAVDIGLKRSGYFEEISIV